MRIQTSKSYNFCTFRWNQPCFTTNYISLVRVSWLLLPSSWRRLMRNKKNFNNFNNYYFFFLQGNLYSETINKKKPICSAGQQSFLVKLSTWIRQIEGEWNSGHLSRQMPLNDPCTLISSLRFKHTFTQLPPPEKSLGSSHPSLHCNFLLTTPNIFGDSLAPVVKTGFLQNFKSPSAEKKDNVSWSLIKWAAWL